MEKGVYQQFYELEATHWWFVGMHSICRAILTHHRVHSHERLLDVGCGTGLWLTQMTSLGQAYGCDISSEALAFCRSRNLQQLVQASGECLPFPEGSFSLITALGVIEHVENDLQMLSEIYRVCEPGGMFFLLTSAYPFLWSYHDEAVHHHRRYWARELKAKIAAVGFEALKVSYVNAILFPAILGVRLVQRLVGWEPNEKDRTPDIFRVPVIINRLLTLLLVLEGPVLKYTRFPFGVGLIVLAQKPRCP